MSQEDVLSLSLLGLNFSSVNVSGLHWLDFAVGSGTATIYAWDRWRDRPSKAWLLGLIISVGLTALLGGIWAWRSLAQQGWTPLLQALPWLGLGLGVVALYPLRRSWWWRNAWVGIAWIFILPGLVAASHGALTPWLMAWWLHVVLAGLVLAAAWWYDASAGSDALSATWRSSAVPYLACAASIFAACDGLWWWILPGLVLGAGWLVFQRRLICSEVCFALACWLPWCSVALFRT
jgi:hypothetical protein